VAPTADPNTYGDLSMVMKSLLLLKILPEILSSMFMLQKQDLLFQQVITTQMVL